MGKDRGKAHVSKKKKRKKKNGQSKKRGRSRMEIILFSPLSTRYHICLSCF